jgi:hypothetical protein
MNKLKIIDFNSMLRKEFSRLFRSGCDLNIKPGIYSAVRHMCFEIEGVARNAGYSPLSEDWPYVMSIGMSSGNFEVDFYFADDEGLNRIIMKIIYHASLRIESTCEECGLVGTLRRDHRSFCVICNSCLQSRTIRLAKIREQHERIRRGEA